MSFFCSSPGMALYHPKNTLPCQPVRCPPLESHGFSCSHSALAMAVSFHLSVLAGLCPGPPQACAVAECSFHTVSCCCRDPSLDLSGYLPSSRHPRASVLLLPSSHVSVRLQVPREQTLVIFLSPVPRDREGDRDSDGLTERKVFCPLGFMSVLSILWLLNGSFKTVILDWHYHISWHLKYGMWFQSVIVKWALSFSSSVAQLWNLTFSVGFASPSL